MPPIFVLDNFTIEEEPNEYWVRSNNGYLVMFVPKKRETQLQIACNVLFSMFQRCAWLDEADRLEKIGIVAATDLIEAQDNAEAWKKWGAT